MAMQTLEEKIAQYGSPVAMLRSSGAGSWNFPLPTQNSSWMEEQRAWAETVALFDMGQHMPSLVIKGPDVKRLLSDISVNSFEKFGKNKAKQYVCCRDDGFVIGDGVVVALEDDEYEVMAIPATVHWIEYQVAAKAYDVSLTYDAPTAMNPGERRFYRYQVQGPRTLELLEKAIGGQLPVIKFFRVGEIEMCGLKVRVIGHSMSGTIGFELFGPRVDGPLILEALRAAGRTVGLREAGALTVPSTYEGGWVGLQVPAVYSGDYMRPFREWLSAYSFEGFASLGGSFNSPDIEDYYVTPWDIGYGHLVQFDHEFIGRAALEKIAAAPRRAKVFLRWNEQDCLDALASTLVGEGPRAKLLGAPIAVYSTFPNDLVMVGDTSVGVSIIGGYSVNVGSWLSLATIETGYAADGTEVEVVWGDADTSGRPLPVETHSLRRIRAIVHTRSPLKRR